MSEQVRGLVLLASVVLWLPFLGPVLDGTLSVQDGVLRYLGALLLAWAGGAGLHALISSYAARSGGEDGGEGDDAALRRTGDVPG